MLGRHALAGILLFGSGAVSLGYEVVWTRRLNVLLGSAAPAAATVFAMFLGGLGIGAALAGRMRVARPLRAYGLLEMVLAVVGASSPLWLGALEAALSRIPAPPGQGGSLMLVRVAGASVLLIPAALMGATLPFVLRHVSGDDARGLPFLYGVNTMGAVAGVLLTGFVLLGALGETGTLRAAAAVNGVVGLIALVAGGRATGPATSGPPALERGQGARRGLLALSFVSGFLTLMLEMVWFRVLGLTVGGSVQALSLLLAAFLVGIAAGGLQAARVAGADAMRALGERLLRVAIAAALLLPLSMAVPVALIRLLSATDQWALLAPAAGLVLAASMAYGTVALGASLPLLALQAHREGVEGARGTGQLYLASALGSIAGGFLTTFLLVPTVGVDGASVLATVLAAAAARGATRSLPRAALVLVAGVSLATPYLYRHPSGLFVTGTYAYAYRYVRSARGGDLHHPRAAWPAYAVLAKPGQEPLVPMDPPDAPTRWLWRRDGVTASVAVGEAAGVRSLVINGKTDASSFGPGDMRTQLLLGHLPALFCRAEGGRALGIGLGSGTTVTALAAHPFDEVVSAEVEPAVARAAAFFEGAGGGLPASVRSILDDGRQVLGRDPGRFTVITSEPSNLWMAGVAHLFTREFFATARARLAPGGLYCQWLHLYQIAPDDVRMLLRTLADVFPRLELFADGPDLLVLAGEEDAFADPAVVASRFERRAVRDHLARGGFDDPARLLETYAGGSEVARRFAGPGALNTDDRPYLEVHAPRSLMRDDASLILQMLARSE